MTASHRLEVVPVTARPAHPHPEYTPERVIRAFLEGVREPDVPTEADGIRSAYHLLDPEYRADVGGFDGFRDRLRSPMWRALVRHTRAERGTLDIDDATATQEVLVADDEADAETGEVSRPGGAANDGPQEVMYEFTVRKQAAGKYEGCWLIEDIVLTMSQRRPGFGHVPTVEFAGAEVKCESGAVLRDVLLRTAGLNPHNDKTTYANCSGNGVCGTCAVQVKEMAVGENVTDPTGQERRRMKLPPHRNSDVPNLRLACQTRVLNDVRVVKHDGMWGQHLAGIDDDVDADAVADSNETDHGPEGKRVRVSSEEYEV